PVPGKGQKVKAPGSSIPSTIELLFTSRAVVTSGEVAAAAGVSRQAAHNHLKALTETGDLIHEGKGRGGRYRRRADISARYPIAGLEEHVVWAENIVALKNQYDPYFFDNHPNVNKVLDFVFTEMLNNAIDHSSGGTVNVRWVLQGANTIVFEIEDDGVGVFRNMMTSRSLTDEFDAIGEISKGKQTTAPAQHSGLGIFFSSKIVNGFVLSSGQLRWTVDSRLPDTAIGWLDRPRVGTLVRCEVDLGTDVIPKDIFDAFSDPTTYAFSKSSVHVSLFREGDVFVSRSEAKRIAAHLESFEVVELDFSGISEVGQGFVDELFRVWGREHLGTRMIPVHANPAILSMIAKTTQVDEL
ncbi:MAG: STAS-like domain-containing protein, partial [Acidimicrobiales bacterium]